MANRLPHLALALALAAPPLAVKAPADRPLAVSPADAARPARLDDRCQDRRCLRRGGTPGEANVACP